MMFSEALERANLNIEDWPYAKRDCERCGESFEPNHHRQRYCGAACQAAAKHGRLRFSRQYMERRIDTVCKIVAENPGIQKTQLRALIHGSSDNSALAIQLAVEAGYIVVSRDGPALRHYIGEVVR